MKKKLHEKRENYSKSEFEYSNLFEMPIHLFDKMYEKAELTQEIIEPNAMTLSTVYNNQPQSRVVLLKEYSEKGFVFFTHYNSRKGIAIESNPNVCLNFWWPALEHQIIINGKAIKLSAQESDKYFYSRPKDSQIGALISHQSQELKEGESLKEKWESRKSSEEPIQRPNTWGGYTVIPYRYEFWQGKPNRLHDRVEFIYNEKTTSWSQRKLQP